MRKRTIFSEVYVLMIWRSGSPKQTSTGMGSKDQFRVSLLSSLNCVVFRASFSLATVFLQSYLENNNLSVSVGLDVRHSCMQALFYDAICMHLFSVCLICWEETGKLVHAWAFQNKLD